MKKKYNDWIIPLISYALSGLSFAFGAYDSLWELLKLDNSLRMPFTICLSILILLIGHFINILQRDQGLYNEIISLKETFLQLPNMNCFRVLPNGDEGVRYLSLRIQQARFIRNTRVPIGEGVKYNTEYSKQYIKETEKLLKNKNVVFKDIIVGSNKSLCENFNNIADKYQSKYEYRIINNWNKGFLNFMIIVDCFNKTEVVFGWPTSETQGYQEKCFISQDKDLVSLFSTIFEDLWCS